MKKRLFPVYITVILVIGLGFSAEAYGKDEWLNIKSKNFNLIGNASEKDIRKAATKLEQFRESFRILFGQTKLSSSIPTNVIVFKNDSAYKPFKPKRADGKTDNFVAGYFQPGEDVNYITLSAGGDDAETFGTIFHEYVHFIVETNFGKSEIPPWFNEGLAEYYQTFVIEDDIKIKLGLPQSGHLRLLQQAKLMPLESLFKVSNYSLHQNGDHSRSIFYAQSWALIHYLAQSGKSDGMNKFLSLSLKSVDQEKAFNEAFQMTYAQMDKELRKYVGQAKFQYAEITFKQKLAVEAGMMVVPLTESDTNAYLGDLLYHTHRFEDSEPYLQKALELRPDSSMAATTLGMVKFRQRKFDDAKKFLEAAVSRDSTNHVAHYWYAYILSRDGRDEFGYVGSFSADTTKKIKELLDKAIRIRPEFTESYELLAFVNLVNNEDLENSIAKLQQALKYQPGNQRYALRIAEIYIRQNKFDEARSIAEKISRTVDDPQMKQRADGLVQQLQRAKEMERMNAESRRRFEDAVANSQKAGTNGSTILVVDQEDEKRRSEELQMVSINRELRAVENGETRVTGRVLKIRCAGGNVTYDVKDAADAYILSSVDFSSLNLMAYVVKGSEVGCDVDISAMNTILTFKPATTPKSKVRGELVSIEFVPENFRFINKPTLGRSVIKRDDRDVDDAGTEAGNPPPVDIESIRRKAMMDQIQAALGSPSPGERRVMGFLERAECGKKAMVMHFKVDGTIMKFTNTQPNPLVLRAFVPDAGGLQVGCATRSIDILAVITYIPVPGKKIKTEGELVSIDFVPASFSIE